MRSFWGGLLGGLAAIAIVAVLIVVGLVVYTRADNAAQRTTLIRQIDEYDSWWRGYGVQMALASSQNPYAATTLRDHFTAQRHPLQEYIAWWQGDFAQRNPVAIGINSFRLHIIAPDDLCDSDAINRFFASR